MTTFIQEMTREQETYAAGGDDANADVEMEVIEEEIGEALDNLAQPLLWLIAIKDTAVSPQPIPIPASRFLKVLCKVGSPPNDQTRWVLSGDEKPFSSNYDCLIGYASKQEQQRALKIFFKGNEQQIKAEIKRCQRSEAIHFVWGAAERKTILDGKQRGSI